MLPSHPGEVTDPSADQDLLSLMEELEELGSVPPPSAARHRGWVAVRTEVRTREARGAFAPAGRLRASVRAPRLALLSAAVLVAIGLGIVAVLHLGAPEQGPGLVDTSVTTATTALADNTTGRQEPSSTTGATTPRTTAPTTPGSTRPTPSVTSGSPVTGAPATSATTGPRSTTTTSGSVTTLPPSSTTSEQLMTSQERERSAKTAAAILAQAVIQGDDAAATAVLASSAARGLAWMKAALLAPSSYAIVSAEDTGPSFARVTVAFTDTSTAGETVSRRFLFEVRVDRAGALVIGIYQAPAE
jgi:hypothetical protein